MVSITTPLRNRPSLTLSRRWFPILMVVPAVLILVAVVVYPIAYAGWLAFHDWDLRRNTVSFVGLDNFRRLVADQLYWGALRTTALYVFLAVAFEFLAGLGLALILHREIRGASILRSIIMLPMFVVPVVVALVWRVIYNQEFGPLFYALTSTGLVDRSAPFGLSNPDLAMPLIVMTSVWQVMPFVFLVFVAGMQSVPQEQYEAARLDGANAFQEFRDVTLPWLKPLILFILLFRVMDSIKVFDLVVMLTNGGPGSVTEVVSLYIYRQGFTYFDLGYASSLALVILAIVIVFSVVLVKLMRVERNV